MSCIKQRNVKNIILCCMIFIYILVYLLVYPKFLNLAESITSAFSVCLFSLSVYLLGYRHLYKNELKSLFFKTTVMIVLGYFVLTYCLGLVVGFLKNSYTLNFVGILHNILPTLITIICIELFRYVFISANKDNKKYIYIITILLSIFEISLLIKFDTFMTISSSFKFLSITILPVIIKNIMCSYIDYYGDYKAVLFYRLIMDLYFYIVPIEPDINEFLSSILALILPFMVIMYCSRYIDNEKMIKEQLSTKKVLRLSDLPLAIIFCLITCVVLGIGPYKLIGIQTGSMSPKIKIGDAVVVDKKCNRDELKEGDIVAYLNNDGLVIVHRIIKINSDKTFITKGDYNNVADSEYVRKEQVQGKVKFKIPWIAYPATMFKR